MGCTETTWDLYRLQTTVSISLVPRLFKPYSTDKLRHSEGRQIYHGTSSGGSEICA
jgi:hypothetical protein